MYIGIDVGYGFTKIAYDEYKYRLFPSIITKDTQVDKDFTEYSVVVDGEKWFVGSAALNLNSKYQLSAIETDRINSEVFKVLFLTGIASCKCDYADIVTGLPVTAYKAFKDDMQSYIGKHTIVIDKEPVTINIRTIKVLPQPLGTYFKLLAVHEELQTESLLLIDIGFKTTDLLKVQKDRVLGSSTSINFGMSDIAREIINYVNQDIDGRTWTINEIDTLLDKGYMSNCKRKNIPGDIVEESFKKTFNAIWSRVKEVFPDYSTLDKVIFTGGTATRFKDNISKLGVNLSSDSQFANAIGFRNVLEWGI